MPACVSAPGAGGAGVVAVPVGACVVAVGALLGAALGAGVVLVVVWPAPGSPEGDAELAGVDDPFEPDGASAASAPPASGAAVSPPPASAESIARRAQSRAARLTRYPLDCSCFSNPIVSSGAAASASRTPFPRQL